MNTVYEESRVKSYGKLVKNLREYINIDKIIKNYNKAIYKIAMSGYSKDKSALYYCNKIESLMIYKITTYDRFLNTKKFLSELKNSDKNLLLDYANYVPTQEIADKYDINVRTVFRKLEVLNKSYESFNRRENENYLVAEV